MPRTDARLAASCRRRQTQADFSLAALPELCVRSIIIRSAAPLIPPWRLVHSSNRSTQISPRRSRGIFLMYRAKHAVLHERAFGAKSVKSPCFQVFPAVAPSFSHLQSPSLSLMDRSVHLSRSLPPLFPIQPGGAIRSVSQQPQGGSNFILLTISRASLMNALAATERFFSDTMPMPRVRT